MIDYQHIDSLILERVGQGAKTFSAIDGGFVYLEAKNLSELTGRQAFRIIDSRLQALRKKGFIRFNKGWVKTEA